MNTNAMKQILFPVAPDRTSESTRASSTAWEALNPLQMAEKIAQMVGSQPTLSGQRGHASLQISTAFLAQESPGAPVPSRNGIGIGGKPAVILTKMENDYRASTEHKRATSSLGGQKRNAVESPPDAVHIIEESEPQLMPWDPTCLLKYNPNETTAKMAVCELATLAKRLESMPKHADCHSSYKRFREGLLEKSKYIFEQRSSIEQKTMSFSQMYSGAIQQMRALIDMAQKIDDDERAMGEVKTETKESEEGDRDPPIFSREYSKKSLTQYMTKWLKVNWTNPYPDDRGLADLAEMNGTTPTIVSNWLINARTRKWRPSIVKAYRANRAADMLLEDSINIFEGKPVRKL